MTQRLPQGKTWRLLPGADDSQLDWSGVEEEGKGEEGDEEEEVGIYVCVYVCWGVKTVKTDSKNG